MADEWEFRNLTQRVSTYSDGTTVPHVDVDVYYNGMKVGYVNLHMHKVKVAIGEIDHSVGVTVRINPHRDDACLSGDRRIE